MNLRALHKIGYGMYVIGSRKDDKLNAQIANTVFQITSEPPTIAVSINKNNLTHEYIQASKVFTASVLCQDTPLTFIGRFGFKSGRDINKLEGVNYKIGATKAPVITDYAVSYLEARVVREVDMGTHTIFIGELVAADIISDDACMTYEYYHEVKRGGTPKAAPSYVAEAKEVVGMAKYRCTVCNYIYDPDLGDPDNGVKAGTPFDKIPSDWACPICGAPKSEFEKLA